ncbi:MAG: hypothetical protein KY455_06720 [Euryarchaeota archaeon]|nr:hypothetical protein [Euryarchaeota archaeon]
MSQHIVALLVVLALLSVVPMAEAAPDARIQEDAKRCSEALVSAASDNATCVVFYGHIEDFLGGGFLNAERPPDVISHRELGVWGPSAPPYWDLHRFDFTLQAGPIEYDPDGEIRVLPGMFRDGVPLVDGVPLLAKVHMTVDQTALPGDTGVDPAPSSGVLPCVTVDALVMADEEVLSGGSAVGHLVRPGAAPPEAGCADEGRFSIDDHGVTTFDIEIPSPAGDVSEDRRIRLVVLAYSHDTAGSRITPPGVRLVQGPDHLNHVVVPFEDGLEVTAVRPQWTDARLYIRTNVSNPWGDYDIDHETLDLQVSAPDGSVIAARSLGDIVGPTVQYEVVHDTTVRPLTAYFEWDLLSEGLEDGRYVLKVSADNVQHLTSATAEASFVLDDGLLWLYDADGVLLHMERLGPAAEASAGGALQVVSLLMVLLFCFGRSRRAD